MKVIGPITTRPDSSGVVTLTSPVPPYITHGGAKTFDGRPIDPNTLTFSGLVTGDMYRGGNNVWSYDGAVWVQQAATIATPGNIVVDTLALLDPTVVELVTSTTPDLNWEPEIKLSSLFGVVIHVPKAGLVTSAPDLGWVYDPIAGKFLVPNTASNLAFIGATLGFAGNLIATYMEV